ncbi:SycD/LcrH family type III secretion system chaperone [Aeromonas salmonicida]|uniref:SycD/LcrH family type III secretion system chaperone n=1 Tax=Aeromonas salmonicida TaxID=645 RepID=UPI00259D74ED|nr:SycD/LcrH family type III secretion system chaperone [Aeromonas salmonicida]MDM5065374.1 SycD/LcrH family type III secretion system chaperone [Aeromonas salmonicida]
MSPTAIASPPARADEKIQRFLTRGGSLRLLTGIEQQDLTQLSAYASQLFEAEDFAAARNLYQLLSTLDHWNVEYLLGQGLSHQRLGGHEEAIACFARAGVIRIDDPRAAFFAGLSYRLLGNEEHARKAFNAAVRWCGDKPEHQDMRASAQKMLDTTANAKDKA